MEHPEPLPTAVRKGCFLIASPEIENLLFFRGVLLICEHNTSGSFAILVNKPLDVDLPEELVNLSSSPNKNVSIRAGGPVQTNQMMLLHSSPSDQQQLLTIADDVYLGGDLQYLHELIEDESSPPVFLNFGYAGWATGQLDREFLDGSWFLYPASRELLFDTPPENLWKTLLLRMGGRYATLSTIPEDLSVN
jgi:putative transcriptional regulator